ncbi:MAG: VIT1/CCC1 transporter family protein [Euryarchaeota archaeon]|nr:VIT1/CCC1 transporter family protein [Euryarchaeota archaeon]
MIKYISSRYIVLGTIDGVIAILGVVIGAFSASVGTQTIIGAGIGGGMALGISNGVGGLMAERTVERRRLLILERSLFRSLEGTHVSDEIKKKLIADTITHGGCSFLGALIPVLPFIFLSQNLALITSITLSIITLFVLGIYIGKITKESILLAGIKMAVIGILVAIFVYFVSPGGH